MFALLVNSILALVFVGVVWRLDMKSKGKIFCGILKVNILIVSLGSKDTPAILAAVEEEYAREKKSGSETASSCDEEKVPLV